MPGGGCVGIIHILFAILLGIVALYTGEIITFIMLGFILLALNNIVDLLRQISKKLNK